MEDHKATVEEFRADMRELVGADLRSLILYGSAATGEFVEKRSDYNFALLVEKADLPLLDRLATRSKKWRKKRIPVPLIFTNKFVEQARDSYPLEFLSMRAGYQLLEGNDFLDGMELVKEDVRHECEREIRSKLLLFRRVYVEAEGKGKHLQAVVVAGMPALSAIARGLLFLKDRPVDLKGDSLWEEAATSLDFPLDLMRHLGQIRRQKKAPDGADVHRDFETLLPMLERLADEVDSW